VDYEMFYQPIVVETIGIITSDLKEILEGIPTSVT
jgi:hypothetical protein